MPLGADADKPQLVNLTEPKGTKTINGLKLDMLKFAAVIEKLGGVDAGDVISIGGYRNAKGEIVPDYDTVKIEKRAEHESDCDT